MADVSELKLFARVVEMKSFVGAGREFGISPSGVTMRIKQLEEKYKTQLLERTTRSVRPTETGRMVYETALRIEEEHERLVLNLTENTNEISGLLRISAPEDFGNCYVAPALNEFITENPKVTAHLELSDLTVDLIQKETDLAVRFGKLENSNFIAKKLEDGFRILCAGKKYLEKRGFPETLRDLQNHSCLVFSPQLVRRHRWYFFNQKIKTDAVKVDINPSIVTSSGLNVRNLALDNAGIALKSYRDVKKNLEDGSLIRVLSEYQVDFKEKSKGFAPLYFLYPSRRYLPKRVSFFIKKLEGKLMEQN